MDEDINKALEMKKPNLKIAQCDECGESSELYVCSHGNLFCKDCLTETIKVNDHVTRFRVKCNKNKECVFNPIMEKLD